MKISYKRELDHNYLILEQEENLFQRGILLSRHAIEFISKSYGPRVHLIRHAHKKQNSGPFGMYLEQNGRGGGLLL